MLVRWFAYTVYDKKTVVSMVSDDDSCFSFTDTVVPTVRATPHYHHDRNSPIEMLVQIDSTFIDMPMV